MNAADLAKNYDKVNSPQFSLGKIFLNKLSIEEGQSVLDVGCGTGGLTALLAEKVGQHGRVLGIDPNEERIALAREKFKDVSNLSFVQAGICEIPRGDVYDIVFSNFVFHWIPDDELITGVSMIRENLMKPGATMAAQVPQPSPVYEEALRLLQETQSKVHFKKAEEYPRLLRRAGFEDITLETDDMTLLFESRQAFRDFRFYSSGGLVDIDDDRLKSIKWEKNSFDEYIPSAINIQLLARK